MLFFSLFPLLPLPSIAQSIAKGIIANETQTLDDGSKSNDTKDVDDKYLTIPSYRHHSSGPVQACDNHDGFWDLENEEASDWGVALYQWSMNIDKTTREWMERTSEVHFFVQDVLGIEGFECGIGIDMGCDQMPDCDTVLTRAVDPHDARRIMYVLASYKNLAIRSAKLHQAIPSVEHKMISFANEMSSVLYPKHDYRKEAECNQLANIVKIGSSILLSLPAVVLPFMAPAAGAAGAAASVGTAVTAGAVTSGLRASMRAMGSATRASMMNRVGSMKRFVGNPIRRGRVANTMNAAFRVGPKTPGLSPGMAKRISRVPTRGHEVWAKADKVRQSPLGTLVTANAVTGLLLFGSEEISDRICNRYPNPPADLEPWYAMGGQMQGHALLEQYAREISDTTTEILAGVGFGLDGTFDESSYSVLTDLIADGSYVQLSKDERDRYYRRPYMLEGDLFEVFKRAFISMTLKLQMCYLACTDNPLHSGPNRLVVDESKGVWCQPQCWGRFGEDHNNQLYGLDYLESHNLTWEFLHGSYRNWEDFRYSNNPEVPTASETDRRIKAAQGNFLPVCFSRAMPPRKMGTPRAEEDAQTLPCICGNDLGNETMVFFRETNMDVMLNGPNNDALIRACQWGADEQEVLPSLTFIMQCDIGYRWPLQSDWNYRHMHWGPDPHCEQVIRLQNEMIEQGKTLVDVNCALCDTRNDLWQAIVYMQQDHRLLREQDKSVIGAFSKAIDLIFHTRDESDYNLRHSCRRFQNRYRDMCSREDHRQDRV